MTGRAWSLLAAAILATAGLAATVQVALSRGGGGSAAASVAEGGRIYASECAGCHGARGQGQAGWERPDARGMLPAPPHDETGHTWQHSDAQLRDWILQGAQGGGAPETYRSDMPHFSGRLTDGEVDDVIAWIKAQWPAGIRAYQAAQNPGGPGLGSIPGDWRFPVTCKPGWGG